MHRHSFFYTTFFLNLYVFLYDVCISFTYIYIYIKHKFNLKMLQWVLHNVHRIKEDNIQKNE